MAILSKEAFDTFAKNGHCSEFFHPWASSCTVAWTDFIFNSIVGSAKFSFIMHTIPLLYGWKRLSKEKFKRTFIDFLRVTAYGSCSCLLFLSCGCILRKIFGRYSYYTIVLIPGFISSTSVFFVAPNQRYTIFTTYVNSFVETVFLLMDYLNICKKSMRNQMLLFMVSNAGILYLLRLWKKNKPNKSIPGLWFYFPLAVERNAYSDGKDSKREHNCPHAGSCITDILKGSWMYFLSGLALGLLRSLIINFGKAKFFKNHIFVRRNLWIALFASTYVALAKGTNCLLCRIRGIDHESYALAAGFLSGLSYYFQPNLTLSVAALSYCISLAWSYHNVNKRIFGGFPVQIIAFMVSKAILFHTHLFASNHTSKVFHNIISTSTNGRSDEIVAAIQNAIFRNL